MASPGQNLDKYPRRFGKYHLLGPLAQGGMGALYLAVTGDRGLERLMVIKTVLPHLADNEYVARFRDEAKVVVKLSHGNLIPVFDAGQVGGELFLAMFLAVLAYAFWPRNRARFEAAQRRALDLEPNSSNDRGRA